MQAMMAVVTHDGPYPHQAHDLGAENHKACGSAMGIERLSICIFVVDKAIQISHIYMYENDAGYR